MPLSEVCFKLWIYMGLLAGYVTSARPRFDTSTDMGLVLVPADAEVDSVIYRLRATDQDANFPLTFDITATASPIVRVENLPCTLYNKVCQANVILTRRLAPCRLHDFAVRVTDTKGNSNSMQATISVTNATTPRDKIFPHIPSLIMVPEDTKPGKELDYLLVRSNPWSGKPVYIELWQSKELFTIRQRQMAEQTRGIITLIGELDFEVQSMYTLTLYATDPFTEPGRDTRNIIGLRVVIAVQDVQDVPPIFTLAPPLTKIENNVKPGDVILRVHAEDGDKGVPRDVTYGLVSEGNPFMPFFNISETSGEIILVKPLEELTKITHVGAPIVLSIVAEEIRRSRDEPPAQSTVVEVGLLLGQPGNSPPYFENNNYMAWIDENSPPGTVLTFDEPYLTRVTDQDIGKAGVFALQLENNNGTFEINPTVAERVAIFIINVRDNKLLDYEEYKSLNFKIIAQEVGPATNLSASVPVVIFLRDVNDNPPMFDQKLYEVTLSENATAGTRVVQVHATDKDTGSYGRVQYTRIIGEGNEALSLDPYTGWIVVTTKIWLLDRELRDKLELSVEARDDDGKGNSAAVPLIVHLLDVNDNAPIFEKDEYEFRLNSDLSNFTSPAFVKAIDADAEAPNNVVRYELIHGNYENKFYLDEITGELVLREAINIVKRDKKHAQQHPASNFTVEMRQLLQNTTVTGTTERPFNYTRLSINLTENARGKLNYEAGTQRKRRNVDDPLYSLTIRAYDLGVPHLSSTTQLYIKRGSIGARIVTFVVPNEHPDPVKTQETLSTITGGRVTVLEIKPYVEKNGTRPGTSKVKKSIVVVRVEPSGPDNPVVDIEKIKKALAASGYGVIGDDKGETVTDKPHTNGTVVNQDVTLEAQNKLLTGMLVALGLIVLLLLILLIICCTCPGCPFYMAPRKRRIHSSETLVVRSDDQRRPKRHLRRPPPQIIQTDYPERKQAWSADPERKNWQFNRRNTKPHYGQASLPGDVMYFSNSRLNDVPSHMRGEPIMIVQNGQARKFDVNGLYINQRDTREMKNFEPMDMDSLHRHEINRGSDIARTRDDHLLNASMREQHFYRDGNAEVMRLVTRGQIEENLNHRLQAVMEQRLGSFRGEGKDILLRRFIEDQSDYVDRTNQDAKSHRSIMSHRSMISHHRARPQQQQELILTAERLQEQRPQHLEEIGPDVQRLIIDHEQGYEKIIKVENNAKHVREILRKHEGNLPGDNAMPTIASDSGVSGKDHHILPTVKVQSLSFNEVALAKQNALLTRLLFEKETKNVNYDGGSYIETQSLPGQVATATQTDRTTATQTDNNVRSRSDNDDSDNEESKWRRKYKGKNKRLESSISRTKTYWMRSPIEEENNHFYLDKRLNILRRKSDCETSLEPKVLQEISDSLDENGDCKDEKVKERHLVEKCNVRYKMLTHERQNQPVESSPSSSEMRKKQKEFYCSKSLDRTITYQTRESPKKREVDKEQSFQILGKDMGRLQKKFSEFSGKKGKEDKGESNDDSRTTSSSPAKDNASKKRAIGSKVFKKTAKAGAKVIKTIKDFNLSKNGESHDSTSGIPFKGKQKNKLQHQPNVSSNSSDENSNGKNKTRNASSNAVRVTGTKPKLSHQIRVESTKSSSSQDIKSKEEQSDTKKPTAKSSRKNRLLNESPSRDGNESKHQKIEKSDAISSEFGNQHSISHSEVITEKLVGKCLDSQKKSSESSPGQEKCKSKIITTREVKTSKFQQNFTDDFSPDEMIRGNNENMPIDSISGENLEKLGVANSPEREKHKANSENNSVECTSHETLTEQHEISIVMVGNQTSDELQNVNGHNKSGNTLHSSVVSAITDEFDTELKKRNDEDTRKEKSQEKDVASENERIVAESTEPKVPYCNIGGNGEKEEFEQISQLVNPSTTVGDKKTTELYDDAIFDTQQVAVLIHEEANALSPHIEKEVNGTLQQSNETFCERNKQEEEILNESPEKIGEHSEEESEASSDFSTKTAVDRTTYGKEKSDLKQEFNSERQLDVERMQSEFNVHAGKVEIANNQSELSNESSKHDSSSVKVVKQEEHLSPQGGESIDQMGESSSEEKKRSKKVTTEGLTKFYTSSSGILIPVAPDKNKEDGKKATATADSSFTQERGKLRTKSKSEKVSTIYDTTKKANVLMNTTDSSVEVSKALGASKKQQDSFTSAKEKCASNGGGKKPHKQSHSTPERTQTDTSITLEKSARAEKKAARASSLIEKASIDSRASVTRVEDNKDVDKRKRHAKNPRETEKSLQPEREVVRRDNVSSSSDPSDKTKKNERKSDIAGQMEETRSVKKETVTKDKVVNGKRSRSVQRSSLETHTEITVKKKDDCLPDDSKLPESEGENILVTREEKCHEEIREKTRDVIKGDNQVHTEETVTVKRQKSVKEIHQREGEPSEDKLPRVETTVTRGTGEIAQQGHEKHVSKTTEEKSKTNRDETVTAAKRGNDDGKLGAEEEEEGKQSTKSREDKPKTKTEPNASKSKCDTDVTREEINTNQSSRYMAWYKQKRAEMEMRRLEYYKEDEDLRPRWLKRSLRQGRFGALNRHRDVDDGDEGSTPRSKRKIRPLVNVESEQLKAIVRQGRRLRRGEKNEDPPVQIYVPERPPPEPEFPANCKDYHLVQHSEYKYEKIPVPFYLHPPPPVPHPSPQLSPEHVQAIGLECELVVNREEDDLSSSGIALSHRLRHQQLLEKKSVFDIAYNEAAPSQLRSDSTTPPS